MQGGVAIIVENVVAVILAGGAGERLGILGHERTKPAIPFAGKYRIIDFTLSNCVNSGIYNVAVMTQYQPRSLTDHIGIGMPWGFLALPDRKIQMLQQYLAREEGRTWYKGTADAVYQNLSYIEGQDDELVLMLSGDHVYKMDYSDMINYHKKRQADVTLSVTRMPRDQLRELGTVSVDEEGQVTSFQEKVKEPKSDLASMGVYVFRKDFLRQCLEEDAQRRSSKHDFARNIFPHLVGNCRLFAYNFEGFWRDVGSVRSYWQTNMKLLDVPPPLAFSSDWPIRTKEEESKPPAILSQRSDVLNSMISNGCIIEGRVEHSVLSPGVRVAENAVVKSSIIMHDTIIGRDSVIDYSILDKETAIDVGCHIGFGDDFQVNREEPDILNTGITIVGKDAKIPAGTTIGRNCTIFSNVTEKDFPKPLVPSGETIKAKRHRASRTQ
ncbi:MAG: glucose-1-phosphate adenylyltransferase subunit GlgD [Dehalococcoidales bacterium]|jgi:glucose-1-phosphate adenylyltransferase|nr:glucose-1-phosphate adenylyltransferase subunit GlgD [Dehalococcoidales bacterium]